MTPGPQTPIHDRPRGIGGSGRVRLDPGRKALRRVGRVGRSLPFPLRSCCSCGIRCNEHDLKRLRSQNFDYTRAARTRKTSCPCRTASLLSAISSPSNSAACSWAIAASSMTRRRAPCSRGAGLTRPGSSAAATSAASARKVMSRRSWTELFFLDEATALSAGHRPCYYCRRETALAFADAWARAHRLARVERHADRHPAARRTPARRREAHSPAARRAGRAARWRDGGVVGRCLPDRSRPGLPLERSRLRAHRESCSTPTACSRRHRPWRRCAPDSSAFCIRACPTSAIGDRQVDCL